MTKNETIIPRMTEREDNATIFTGSGHDAIAHANRMTAEFHAAGKRFFVGAIYHGQTNLRQFKFRVDHTGRENWISNSITECN